MKKKTSIVVEDNLWQEVKIHCIKSKIDISDWLNKIMKKELEKE